MRTGYVKLHRKIQDSSVWNDRPFAAGQALIDLVLCAAWKDTVISGRPVRRGQFLTTVRKLGDRWGWSNGRVLRFLEELEREGAIKTDRNATRNTGGTLVTFVNYERYQMLQDEDNGAHNVDGTQNGTEHKRVQKRNTKRNTKSESLFIGKSDSAQASNGTQNGTETEHKRVLEEEVKNKENRSSQPNGWALWVDACREAGRADPVRIGKNLSAAKNLLAALNGDGAEFKRLCAEFLADTDPWIVSRGHGLCDLSGKIERYRNPTTNDDAGFFAAADEAAERLAAQLRKAKTTA